MSDTQRPTAFQTNAPTTWVVRLPSAQAALLGPMRLVEGICVRVDGADLWLKCDQLNSALLQRIRMIPDAELFTLRQNRGLTRPDSIVPCDRLPEGEWQPLKHWLQLVIPQAGFAPSIQTKVSLTLVRTSIPQPANVLLTDWSVWKSFAVNAPAVRLQQLAFAVSNDWQVLIAGTPLPPISGKHFVESHGIMVPTGWRFEPDVEHRVVSAILSLSTADFAIFREDGSYERLSRSSFVQASRSAVRATDE